MSALRNRRLNVTVADAGIITFTIPDCANCGVPFAVPTDYDARRREDGKSFRCPNGHVMSYSESISTREEALRRDLELEQERAKFARNVAQEAREEARRADYQRRAAKGQVTKMRNQIANGLCPCCRRTFQNVAAHMQSQHPDFSVPNHEEDQ